MSSSEGVALHPTLQSMFRQHLNDSATVIGSLRVPLEISVSDLEALIKLVRVQLVGREDSECLRVELDDLGDV